MKPTFPAAHVPTEQNRQTIEAMSGYGLTQQDIAVHLDIDPRTLVKYYGRELEVGPVKAKTRVLQAAYQQAVSGTNVFATWAWLRSMRRAGDGISKLGKKEIAMIEARTAHTISQEWAELVGQPLIRSPS